MKSLVQKSNNLERECQQKNEYYTKSAQLNREKVERIKWNFMYIGGCQRWKQFFLPRLWIKMYLRYPDCVTKMITIKFLFDFFLPKSIKFIFNVFRSLKKCSRNIDQKTLKLRERKTMKTTSQMQKKSFN